MMSPRPLVLVLVLVLVLGSTGCKTIENARAAQDPARAVPGERTPAAGELGLPVAGPITEAMIVRAALRAHPTVVLARRRAEGAAAQLGQAESAYYPQLSAGSDFTLSTANPGSDGRSEPHTYGSWGFGFNVSWLIFDFGRTHAIVRAAAQDALAAQEELRDAEAAIAFGARTAFFELEKQIELLAVARETVRQFEARLDFVRELVKVGNRIPYDETKAEVDLGNARLVEVQTRDALRIAQARLANAVGLAELTDWAPDVRGRLAGVPATFEDAWEEARVSLPAIAAARAREQAASEIVTAQIADLLPRITASFGFSSGGSAFPMPWNFSFGPSLDWTLFDGLANLYSIDEAAANLRASRTARAAVEQEAWLGVRTAYVSIENARVRLDLTDLIVKSAEENLDLAKGRYEVGAGTAVDLTDAQQALAQARADRVTARADHDTAIALLWRALGITVGKASP